ncbi:PASTA domain-containing protein [Atopobiaceae bacterium 24-176]
MKCPQCGKDLGDNLLPARCPACGANLRDSALVSGARDAGASRRSVEGLTGIGKGSAKGKGRRRLQLALALVLVVAFCFGMAWTLRWAQGTMKHVPDVVGWRYERAERELKSLGYDVSREDTVDKSAKAGIVVSAHVPEGGGTALLKVASARTMPDVSGKTLEEAEKALDEAGVSYAVEERAGDGEDGVVSSASLKAGREVVGDTTVTLYVTRRPRVPDVVGKTRQEAVAALSAAGLGYGVVDVPHEAGKAVGSVVSVDPAAGTAVAPGEKVKIGVISQRKTLSEDTAEKAIAAVYNATPSGDSIGQGLLPLLSPSSPFAGKSAQDVWYGMVKAAGGHEGVDARIQSLPRSVNSVSLTVSDDGSSAEAQVSVHWDWTPLGEGYRGVTSDDVHRVSMTFDDEGRLLTFYDPQCDVPTYRVES